MIEKLGGHWASSQGQPTTLVHKVVSKCDHVIEIHQDASNTDPPSMDQYGLFLD